MVVKAKEKQKVKYPVTMPEHWFKKIMIDGNKWCSFRVKRFLYKEVALVEVKCENKEDAVLRCIPRYTVYESKYNELFCEIPSQEIEKLRKLWPKYFQ